MLSTSFLPALVFVSILPSSVLGHLALWNPGMYCFNGTNATVANYNNAAPVQPLRQSDNFSYKQWWGHGYLNLPPKQGDFMMLPAGGVLNGEIACNRAFTQYRNPLATKALPAMCCEDVGPLHTILNFGEAVNTSLLGGTALSIAYESDVTKLTPASFTVFSINQASPWTRQISYKIPKDMPACPQGGCHCSWNWIHTTNNVNAAGRGEGYGQEMYQVIYKCKVSGATNKIAKVAPGQIANNCERNPSNCTIGPKQPHFWALGAGCNNFEAKPPTHNTRFGFKEGAQNDIFSYNGAPAPHGTVGGATMTKRNSVNTPDVHSGRMVRRRFPKNRL